MNEHAIIPGEIAVLAALASARGHMREDDLVAQLRRADVPLDGIVHAIEELLLKDRIVPFGDDGFELTEDGSRFLIDVTARLEQVLDPSPSLPGTEDCPSIPWLTTVQTAWIDAVSINYAVDPDALATLLPHPLVPEVHHGSAWVQVLISSLRDMRPQGTLSAFGVDFHQISYRAATTYTSADGVRRRGGYFVRSETDHSVMRTVGNALKEFKFHEFGLAEMMMLREGDKLTIGIAPTADHPGGNLICTIDTRAGQPPPSTSVWKSVRCTLDPLVDCYDAFGVADGYVYILTIDREPWNPRFVNHDKLYVEYFDVGPLGGGAARLDSILYIPQETAYKWRPLRRERWLEP